MTRTSEAILSELGPIAIPSCHVLRSQGEIEAAEEVARELGLVPNPQSIKSWDNLIAIRIITGLGLAQDDAIVDLGCRSGILLTWLTQLGYRNLSGCDLQNPFPPLRSAIRAGLWQTTVWGAVAYARHRARMFRAPVERTGLPGRRYSVVASMSVIEHGVDVPEFFAEAARLLRPGGTLVISTDYWPTPMDIGSLRRVATSHGADRIFDRKSVRDLCAIAENAGLVIPSSLELDAGEPVVSFAGYRYTFLLLAFRRAFEPAGSQSGAPELPN